MDLELFHRVNDLNLTPEEKISLYYDTLEGREGIARQVADQGLPAEQRSYSFTGLGLKRA